MKFTIVFGLFFSLIIHSASGQKSYSAADILHHMQKLRAAGSVLYVAAHPDDENTRLISYLSKEKKFRTAYLSLTRGEGGQNLIGKEIGPALGVLRTQELLAARSIDGAEQYFTRAADFGYSKNPEETFHFWNRDSVLSDMVLVIRKLKPDVIICRFPTSSYAGHGHHTASAILALEAAEVAADKNRFPEQLNNYATWQTKRVYWNTYNFSSGRTIGPGQFSVDVGGYNPTLGRSYGEIASESRSMHKSQGFGTVKQRGSNPEYFKLLRGDSIGPDMFSAMDLTLNRYAAFSKTDKLIADCIKNYDASSPYKSVKALTEIYRTLESVKDKNPEVQHWKKIKMEECAKLLVACSGLWIEATSSQPYTTAGGSLQVLATAINRTDLDIELLKLSLNKKEKTVNERLRSDKTFTLMLENAIPPDAELSNPFWLEQNGSAQLSVFNRSSLAGQRAYPPTFTIVAEVKINGLLLEIKREVFHKRGDPVKGEIYEPMYVLPAVDISLGDKVYIFTKGERKKTNVTVRAYADSVSGSFSLQIPEGWRVELEDSLFTLTKGNVFTSTAWIENKGAEEGTINAIARINNRKYDAQVRWVDYDHIPRQVMQEKAAASLVCPDLKRGIKKVGYIPGAGDEVAESLQAAGYEVTLLDPGQLDKNTLQGYEAIVTGIRAFNVHTELHKKMDVLLNFVKEGGNLVVQYNTNSWVGPLDFAPGPYPFNISRLRTTDEKAKIEITDPRHPAFTSPNTISYKDFDGWVQERGIYFAADVDERYNKLLRMHDKGEEPLDGSLITTKYGKGNFVYTGLVFFRQLPAGVPGAFRLFANLLALPTEK